MTSYSNVTFRLTYHLKSPVKGASEKEKLIAMIDRLSEASMVGV